jgi:hypothetical protein
LRVLFFIRVRGIRRVDLAVFAALFAVYLA